MSFLSQVVSFLLEACPTKQQAALFFVQLTYPQTQNNRSLLIIDGVDYIIFFLFFLKKKTPFFVYRSMPSQFQSPNFHPNYNSETIIQNIIEVDHKRKTFETFFDTKTNNLKLKKKRERIVIIYCWIKLNVPHGGR